MPRCLAASMRGRDSAAIRARAASRLVRTTDAPASARARDIAEPRWPVPPVIRTTLPERSKSSRTVGSLPEVESTSDSSRGDRFPGAAIDARQGREVHTQGLDALAERARDLGLPFDGVEESIGLDLEQGVALQGCDGLVVPRGSRLRELAPAVLVQLATGGAALAD